MTVTCSKCGAAKSAANFHRMSARSNGLRPDCKDCRQPIQRAYRRANPAQEAARQARWRKANPEAAQEIQRRHRAANTEKRRAICRAWQQKNKAADAARSASQRAIEKRATPAWANKRYIHLFYEMARLEELRTGKKVHVDHIVPLNSPFVCGLHVEDNLQLLFAVDNIAKKNKLDGGGLSL